MLNAINISNEARVIPHQSPALWNLLESDLDTNKTVSQTYGSSHHSPALHAAVTRYPRVSPDLRPSHCLLQVSFTLKGQNPILYTVHTRITHYSKHTKGTTFSIVKIQVYVSHEYSIFSWPVRVECDLDFPSYQMLSALGWL